nr:PREDICTED: uncharacterized protein LOC107398923 isoform X1 [Tribolium castaneum]|eukprot:XP_015839981.1 PREDICTED: uncharacterized protein LOC107398923 isoform X1 [Tribolium castaneum]
MNAYDEMLLAGKSSTAGSTSTITGFSAHSLKSGDSQTFGLLRDPSSDAEKETEVFSPAKAGQKRPAPSRSPQITETRNRFSSLSNEESKDSEPLVDVGVPSQGEKRKKKKSSSSKQSCFTPTAPSWFSIAAGRPSDNPEGPIPAAPPRLNPDSPSKLHAGSPQGLKDSSHISARCRKMAFGFPKDQFHQGEERSVVHEVYASRKDSIPHLHSPGREDHPRCLEGNPSPGVNRRGVCGSETPGFQSPTCTHRMHTGKKQLPLVLLEAPLDQAKEVWKMKTVCSLMVKVEKPRKSGKAAQCHRYQRFFHAQRNCTAEHRCVKCGEAHDTKVCTKESKEPPKCANCNGPHTTNYRGCPQFPKLQKTAAPRTTAPAKVAVSKAAALKKAAAPQANSRLQGRRSQGKPYQRQRRHQKDRSTHQHSSRDLIVITCLNVSLYPNRLC